MHSKWLHSFNMCNRQLHSDLCGLSYETPDEDWPTVVRTEWWNVKMHALTWPESESHCLRRWWTVVCVKWEISIVFTQKFNMENSTDAPKQNGTEQEIVDGHYSKSLRAPWIYEKSDLKIPAFITRMLQRYANKTSPRNPNRIEQQNTIPTSWDAWLCCEVK
jgi:hypothetical protein